MSDIRRDAIQPVSKATGHHLFGKHKNKKLSKEEEAALANQQNQQNLPHVMIPSTGVQPLYQQQVITQPVIAPTVVSTGQPILTSEERVIGEAQRIVGTDTLLPAGQTNIFGSQHIQSFEAQNIGQILDAGIMSDLQNKISQPFTQTQPTIKQGISGAFQTMPNVLPQNANIIAGQLDTNLNQGVLNPTEIPGPQALQGQGSNMMGQNMMGQNMMGGVYPNQSLYGQQNLMGGSQNLMGQNIAQANLMNQNLLNSNLTPEQILLAQQGGLPQAQILASQNPSLVTGLDTTNPAVLQQNFEHQLPVTNILQQGLAPNVIGGLPSQAGLLGQQNLLGNQTGLLGQQNLLGNQTGLLGNQLYGNQLLGTQPGLINDAAILNQNLPITSSSQLVGGLPAETAVRTKMANSEQVIAQDLNNLNRHL